MHLGPKEEQAGQRLKNSCLSGLDGGEQPSGDAA